MASEEIVPYEAMAMVARPEVIQFAEVVVKSGLAPKSFDTKEKVLMALAFGRELGISPMQSLQGLNVINGRIGIGGDLAKALCDRTGVRIEDEMSGEGDDYGCTVHVFQNGVVSLNRRFTVADAKKARLWNKAGPWSDYPDRMLYYRALGFALRDAFPNVLKGLKTTEELQDYQDVPQPRPIIYERPRQDQPHPADVVAQPAVDAGPKRKPRKREVDETPQAPVADEAPTGENTSAREPADDVPLSPESAEFIGEPATNTIDPVVTNLCADIRERLRVASYNEARLMRTLASDFVKYKTKKGFVKEDWRLEDLDLEHLQKLVKHWTPLLDLIRKETGS